MAGGIGSRFWPFSRTNNPKQFHDVLGTGKTLIQQTAHRFRNICPNENIYVVTNADYKNLVKEQLPFLSDDQILCEPIGRNTAPCIAYAGYKILQKDSLARIIVAPSDHIILDEQGFEEKAKIGLEACANQDILITLGIKPSRPDTGYGYIQFLAEEQSGLNKVKTFTEKPELEIAEKFLESGDFVWNAGIFIWSVGALIKGIEEHMPELAELFAEGAQYFYTENEEKFIAQTYTQCKNISIDYGLMEKASNVYVVLSDFGWNDLGTWKSLYEIQDKDENKNVFDGNIVSYDTKNSIVKTPKERLVVVEGLDGYIVAEYDNVLMICRKDQEQRVKEFVSDVKAKKLSEYY